GRNRANSRTWRGLFWRPLRLYCDAAASPVELVSRGVRVSDLLRPSPPATWRDRVETAVALVRSAPRLSAALAVAVVIVGALGLVLFRRAPPAPAIQLPRVESAPASTPTTAGEVVVDVAGAVLRPGVVRLGGPGRV